MSFSFAPGRLVRVSALAAALTAAFADAALAAPTAVTPTIVRTGPAIGTFYLTVPGDVHVPLTAFEIDVKTPRDPGSGLATGTSQTRASFTVPDSAAVALLGALVASKTYPTMRMISPRVQLIFKNVTLVSNTTTGSGATIGIIFQSVETDHATSAPVADVANAASSRMPVPSLALGDRIFALKSENFSSAPHAGETATQGAADFAFASPDAFDLFSTPSAAFSHASLATSSGSYTFARLALADFDAAFDAGGTPHVSTHVFVGGSISQNVAGPGPRVPVHGAFYATITDARGTSTDIPVSGLNVNAISPTDLSSGLPTGKITTSATLTVADAQSGQLVRDLFAQTAIRSIRVHAKNETLDFKNAVLGAVDQQSTGAVSTFPFTYQAVSVETTASTGNTTAALPSMTIDRQAFGLTSETISQLQTGPNASANGSADFAYAAPSPVTIIEDALQNKVLRSVVVATVGGDYEIANGAYRKVNLRYDSSGTANVSSTIAFRTFQFRPATTRPGPTTGHGPFYGIFQSASAGSVTIALAAMNIGLRAPTDPTTGQASGKSITNATLQVASDQAATLIAGASQRTLYSEITVHTPSGTLHFKNAVFSSTSSQSGGTQAVTTLPLSFQDLTIDATPAAAPAAQGVPRLELDPAHRYALTAETFTAAARSSLGSHAGSAAVAFSDPNVLGLYLDMQNNVAHSAVHVFTAGLTFDLVYGHFTSLATTFDGSGVAKTSGTLSFSSATFAAP